MYVKVCRMCKTKFYSARAIDSGYKESDFDVLGNSIAHKKKPKEDAPIRTSTPVSDENDSFPSFSNSTFSSDHFYYTWESDIFRDFTTESDAREYQERMKQQQQQYPVQYFYYCFVVMPSYVPPPGLYYQAIGYRPDGTYGTLPYFWWINKN